MKFWAIAYNWQEDVFCNFLVEEDMMDMNEEFLLPTEQMAWDYINSVLSINDYTPVVIEVESYRNGVMTWNRGPVPAWDELYDVDDYYDDPIEDIVEEIVEAEIIEETIEDEVIEEEIYEEEGGW